MFSPQKQTECDRLSEGPARLGCCLPRGIAEPASLLPHVVPMASHWAPKKASRGLADSPEPATTKQVARRGSASPSSHSVGPSLGLLGIKQFRLHIHRQNQVLTNIASLHLIKYQITNTFII